MSEGVAESFGPSVRVNTLMSGTMFTDVSKAWDMPAFNEEIKSIALQRGGQPSEIVGAAVPAGHGTLPSPQVGSSVLASSAIPARTAANGGSCAGRRPAAAANERARHIGRL